MGLIYKPDKEWELELIDPVLHTLQLVDKNRNFVDKNSLTVSWLYKPDSKWRPYTLQPYCNMSTISGADTQWGPDIEGDISVRRILRKQNYFVTNHFVNCNQFTRITMTSFLKLFLSCWRIWQRTLKPEIQNLVFFV